MTVYGNDIVDQIVEYAIVGNISKIVMGRSRKQWIFKRGRLEVLEQLTYRAPNIDVYIIPDMKNAGYFREGKKKIRGAGIGMIFRMQEPLFALSVRLVTRFMRVCAPIRK